MQNSVAEILEYNDVKHAVETIDKEIETLNILKNNLDVSSTKALDLLQNTKGRIKIAYLSSLNAYSMPLYILF